MRISVLGAGHVGAVSAACLARDGHTVVAVDRDARKVSAIAAGRSPVAEPEADRLTAAMVQAGRLTATTDMQAALHITDVSFVCVGTPAKPDGALDTTDIVRVSSEIGSALSAKNDRHAVIIRSTVLPGTTESVILPVIEATAKKIVGADIGLAYYPEFMREGSSIADYDDPGSTIIGVADEETRDLLRVLIAPRVAREMPIATAEAVKYANNAWHGLKVSFANEIGRFCKANGIDGHDVMEALVADNKLNMSPAYLTPGFAFGGSCLPKDISALRNRAAEMRIGTPVLDAILASNNAQIEAAIDLIAAAGNRRVAIVGLSFKPGTDDLRSSPLVELAARLAGKDYDVVAYDPAVQKSRVTSLRLPKLASTMLADPAELAAAGRTVVIGNSRLAAPLMPDLLRAGVAIVDLARVERMRKTDGAYAGIAW
jgi:GDP-mannose 6-dehydrogenase